MNFSYYQNYIYVQAKHLVLFLLSAVGVCLATEARRETMETQKLDNFLKVE